MSQLPPLSSGSRRLVLVRHGETDWNQQGKMQGGGFDIELNDNGRKQAVFVADALQAMTFGAVASSHLARASQTADVIHCSQEQRQQTAVERVSRMAFGEMRFGVFEGVTMRGPESTDEWKSRYKCVNSQLMLDVTHLYLDFHSSVLSGPRMVTPSKTPNLISPKAILEIGRAHV